MRKVATASALWPALFQRSGEASEALRDLAGDAGAAARGVERQRIGPREAEGLAHVGVAQFGEQDAVALRIGERDVGAAGAGELGVELDAVADIDDDEERRAAFAGGERAGVLLGLAAGLEHGFIPRRAAALGVPFFAAFAFALVASASASAASRFSTPCLASRTKQPRL